MSHNNYTLDDFNFQLPENQIAQFPQEKRDHSKLFVLPRRGGEYNHDLFYNLPKYLHDGDLLVFNNAKVIHARIYCKRKTGGKVELVLARMLNAREWYVITNRTKKLQVNEELISIQNSSVLFTVVERVGEYLKIESNIPLEDEVLRQIGEVPLPPYIKRNTIEGDDTRYQTVYAEVDGAVAAPTAGLHFTDILLEDLKNKGVEICMVTLYVSWGTFSPVRTDKIENHNMHVETYVLSTESAEKINSARNDKHRIISVGTTSLRVLESTFDGQKNIAGCGETSIFIYPPYEIKSADGLITNFHTPKIDFAYAGLFFRRI
jgi:S-adenosylmethionine:tRNA ribosyltransferase-isomerase